MFALVPDLSTTDTIKLSTINSYIDDSILELDCDIDKHKNPNKAYALYTLYQLCLSGYTIESGETLDSLASTAASVDKVESLKDGFKAEFEDKKETEMIRAGKYKHPENIYGIWFDQLPLKADKQPCLEVPFMM